MRDELAWAIQRGVAEIGDYSYGAPQLRYVALGLRFLCGKYCSFGPDVQVMLASNHRHDWVSTYPFPAFADEWPAAAGLTGHVAGKGDVEVGHDVWVGANVMLSSGVRVGDGAVIAARSVVVKDVPPYAIVGGNPARLIRYRFDAETIAALLELRWWDWPHERVEANIPLLLSGDMQAFIDANTPRPPRAANADPRIAAALGGVHQAREAALAATPLVAMAAWVAKGAPPPAEQLRSWGFAATLREPTAAAAERAGKLSFARRAFVDRWGPSIPCAEAVAALRALGPLVEIGSGVGVWSGLLRNAGHDATAEETGAASAGRDVLCVWPTADDSGALGAAWRLAPGQGFALVGDGGAGSKGLRRYLATRFDKVAEVELPQFPNVHDRLVVYRKRAPRAAEA